MKLLNILFIVLLLNISGCAILKSNADDISRGAPRTADGAIKVNASEEGGQTTGKMLAEYKTEYNEKSGGRAHNIKLAASKINGATIAPGATFSYNDTLGPTGKANGYKKARIFVRGKDADGYGGGVCQVSSTLYNCALELGLEITERHPHSKHVGYVPENKDAATSYGGKDLKFVNTSGKTLKIAASANDGVLHIKLGAQL